MAEVDARPPVLTAPTVVDERAARAELRRQVADLERRLADAVCSAFPGDTIPHAVAPPRRGPRVLTLGELEALRDALAQRLQQAQRALEARGAGQEAARIRLERMLLAPGEHRFEQVTREDLGETGCGAYQVRPRLGIVGLLAGWWHVKLSSGCPLVGRRARRRPEPQAPPREAVPPPAAPAAPARRRPGRARLDELPRAPWHPVPVGELCVLVGLVLIAVGFLSEGERARVALVAGIVLASIAGLEQALREHLAGFRSHTTLLAGFVGLALGAGTSFVIPYAAAVAVAVGAFALVFWRLRAAFKARAGVGFRA